MRGRLPEAEQGFDWPLLRLGSCWCWQSPSADVRTAVVCAFYEHLPKKPVLRRDMPRGFGRVAFTELRDVFRYHLSPDEAAAFEREFFEAEQR